ncbi:MAG TPA: MBL fold metallo-hydrolase, partial [Myxococcaceae bacterium]|nr:MBL fold metallo-hydrolase [Myxococcaceae bacterium]
RMSRPRSVFLRVLGVSAAVIAAGVGVASCALSAPRHRGPPSDHFRDGRFFNLDGAQERSFGETAKWILNRDVGPWHEQPDAPPGPPPARRVELGQLRVTFVNHATVLIQVDGLNILTDPIWSERASPVSWAGPKRVRPPGIRFEDLPPIDAVLLSHNHYDHMDLPTLRRLVKAFPRVRIFAGLGNRQFLEAKGLYTATDLDWWHEARLSKNVDLVSVPVQHFSARGLTDRNGTLWTGYVIRGPAGVTYFAGDTGYGSHFRKVGERYGPVRLAVLPIGAYKPEWFMSPVHVSPAEAVKAHRELGAFRSVAVHFGTFALADDGQEEPVVALRESLQAARVPEENFWVLGFGEGRDVPPQR